MFELKGDYLSWFGVFFSLLVMYYSFKYQYSKGPLEKQLYKVYLPMFLSIEKILYKKVEVIKPEDINRVTTTICEITDKHYELIKPDIIHWNKVLTKQLKETDKDYESINETYLELCSQIESQFEKTRRKMSLPTRGILYKLNNKQFASKSSLIINSLIVFLPPLLIIIGIALLFNLIIYSIN
ncbi:hypothetical protein [Paenibacillus sp. LK1]|uniref:hypothetical protein n=1 Tax=Paenibacillus sp. LK1 TaxID=2053014 RepID=UPI000C193608|nr:hypothetical protein [Paenibacillus sp. LK1]PIH60407.1 hypothetical protein CS562_04740 [Paenibacillus sp. LK1]